MSEPVRVQILRAQMNQVERDAWSALRGAGFADAEIENAITGLLSGGLSPIDADGEHADPLYWHVGALRAVKWARQDLDRGDTEGAERWGAEAERQGSHADREAGAKQRAAGRVKAGKARKGRKAPITLLIEKMLEDSPALTAADALAEFDKDARGDENMLTGLREEGRTTIAMVHVDAEGFRYTVGGLEKSMTSDTLNNRFSEARKAIANPG